MGWKKLISAKEKDPCSSENFTQNISAENHVIQFNLRTDSGLSEYDPYTVSNKNNPLLIASKKDIFGYEIITDINNNIINTGNGQRLGSTSPSPDHRMNKLPVVGNHRRPDWSEGY